MMTITFDQNALRDTRLIRYLELSDLGTAEPSDLEPGAVVRLVDEDDDSYLATVISRAGDRFEFQVDIDSLTPAMTVEWEDTGSEQITDLMEALRASVFVGEHSAEPGVRSVPEPNIKRPVVTRVA
jgi:hypothetical protein